MMQHSGERRGTAAVHAEHNKRSRPPERPALGPGCRTRAIRRPIGERYVVHP
jgi:hypothetical protein